MASGLHRRAKTKRTELSYQIDMVHLRGKNVRSLVDIMESISFHILTSCINVFTCLQETTEGNVLVYCVL